MNERIWDIVAVLTGAVIGVRLAADGIEWWLVALTALAFGLAPLFELRGPGELLGTRQTGLPQYRVADLTRDAGFGTLHIPFVVRIDRDFGVGDSRFLLV